MSQPIFINNRGFAAIISTLIIGALIFFIVLGVIFRSKEQVLAGVGYLRINKALGMANLCAEVALVRLQTVLDYNGNETITVDGESCDILLIDGLGNSNRTVKTRSTVGSSTIAVYTKKIKVEVSQISPTLIITSWQEVIDF